jgi:peptide deformylase
MQHVKGSVKEIRIYGDPILRRKARRVEAVDEKLLQLVADLLETMLVKDGLGLAANQIGELKSVIAINPRAVGIEQEPFVLINPAIAECSGAIEREEACLSLPGISEVLARPAKARVVALDPTGKAVEVDAEGTLARALHHEIDHVNGILFIDHLPPVRRHLLKDRLKELKARSCA